MDAAAVAATASFFEELPGDRADATAAGLFGLHTDSKCTTVVADNVRKLWPELWPCVGEDTRHAPGCRQNKEAVLHWLTGAIGQRNTALELSPWPGTTA